MRALTRREHARLLASIRAEIDILERTSPRDRIVNDVVDYPIEYRLAQRRTELQVLTNDYLMRCKA